jgi:hypothetical protein
VEIDGDFDPDFGCTVLIANNDATGGGGGGAPRPTANLSSETDGYSRTDRWHSGSSLSAPSVRVACVNSSWAIQIKTLHFHFFNSIPMQSSKWIILDSISIMFMEMPLPPHAMASRQFENIVAEAIVSQLLAPSDENETFTSRICTFSNAGMSLNP